MNRAQEEELKRFTPTMWALLRYTAKHCPMAKIGGPWLRCARVLAGPASAKWHSVTLSLNTDYFCRVIVIGLKCSVSALPRPASPTSLPLQAKLVKETR